MENTFAWKACRFPFRLAISQCEWFGWLSLVANDTRWAVERRRTIEAHEMENDNSFSVADVASNF